MIPHTMLAEAFARCGVPRTVDPGLFGAVTIDSRTARPGDIFCAFAGERVDGHGFVPALAARGVLCVGSEELSSPGYAQVPDVVEFLAHFSRIRRAAQCTSVLALTGSSGKTTTRAFAVRMLELSGRVAYGTTGNLNNHIGLPLTLLNLPLQCDAVVLEMGMNHSGEIAHLCRIADPDAALITNIGFAHIGNFPSHEALAQAKLEIFEHSRGTVVADALDRFEASWIAAHPERPVRTFTTEQEGDADIALWHETASGRLVLRWAAERYERPQAALPPYLLQDLVAAAALTAPFVTAPERLLSLLDGVPLPPYRGERLERGARRFIADCYNANPDSMRQAIDHFVAREDMASENERYLVLGDMAELGAFSEKFHRELVNHLKTLTVVSKTFLVGEEFEKVRKEFIDDDRFLFFSSIPKLRAALPARGSFLVKGSRRNRLETLFMDE